MEANRLDATLYVPRATDSALSRALHRGFNVLVLGESGSGKTSMVNHARFVLRREVNMTIIPSADVGGGADLVRRIAQTVLSPDTTMSVDVPARTLIRELRDLLEHRADRDDRDDVPDIWVIDGAPASSVWELFGAHRDDVWTLGAQWVITGDVQSRAELARPPVDAFVNFELVVSALDDAQCKELIARRTKGDPSWSDLADKDLAAVLANAGGNPRRLIQLASRAMTLGSAARDTASTFRERERRLAALGRSASMLAAELTVLGQASASDTRLLQQLGWTRPRAAQVFKDLDDAGLVTSALQRGATGRPRRVFRLASPEEFADHLLQEGFDDGAQ